MKTIILFGHTSIVQAAFVLLDGLLREREIRDIVLVQTSQIEQATEKRLRTAGGELWYCGPTRCPPGGGWSPVQADRELLAEGFGALPGKVLAALEDFLRKARLAA